METPAFRFWLTTASQFSEFENQIILVLLEGLTSENITLMFSRATLVPMHVRRYLWSGLNNLTCVGTEVLVVSPSSSRYFITCYFLFNSSKVVYHPHRRLFQDYRSLGFSVRTANSVYPICCRQRLQDLWKLLHSHLTVSTENFPALHYRSFRQT